jgi:hypothetical protein
MAPEIQLRFYEELNDFLPPDKRKRAFACPLDGDTTVEQLLERFAVPKTGVELVLVNGDSAPFSCHLKEGDFVSIYPVFESLDVTALVRAHEKPLRLVRFMAGAGLLRLAGYLRLLGLDTLDSCSWAYDRAVHAAEEERRILLTRDPSWLNSPELSRVFLVRAAEPGDQLLEVLSRFDLFDTVDSCRLQSILLRSRLQS